MRHRSDWLVIAQFALLLLLLLPGEPAWGAAWLTAVCIALVAVGVAIATAGLAVLGRDIVPWVAPRLDAPLRTRGIYRLTRNPIYLGIIAAGLGWALWRARIELVVVWGMLTVVLVVKAHVEQRYLLVAYGDAYRDYARRTPLMLWGRGIR